MNVQNANTNGKYIGENRMSEEPKNTGETRNPDGTFKEGVSGNPKGKPKGSFSLIAILRSELQKCPEGEDKKTFADMLIKRMLKSAISEGNDQQIKNILQYIDGMPKQSMDHTTNGKDLTVTIVDYGHKDQPST